MANDTPDLTQPDIPVRLSLALATAQKGIAAALAESSTAGANARSSHLASAVAALNTAASTLAEADRWPFLLCGTAGGSEMQRSEAALFEDAPDALMMIDATSKILSINAEFERLFGYRREHLVGRRYNDIFPIRFRSHAGWSTTPPLGRTTTIGTQGSFFVPCEDGTELAVEIKAARLDGGRILASVRDASELQRSDAGFRHALSLLGATLESATDGILVVTLDGRIAGRSSQFLTMWGISVSLADANDDELLLTFVRGQLVDPDRFVARVRDLYGDPESESSDDLELKDGRIFERQSRPQRVGGVVVGRVWTFRDATARRRAESQTIEAHAAQAELLDFLVGHDSLTGLINRAQLNERLERALAGSEAGTVSVLLLDLDDFRKTNDVLGAQAGDEILTEVGRRLKASVRATDTVARFGSDEFIVILNQDKDPEAVASRILFALTKPMVVAGKQVRSSVSMGISGGTDSPPVPSEMIRRADIAMSAAKAAGKGGFLRFQPDMLSRLLDRAQIEDGLREAVTRNEITVHLQPILSADHQATQVEALARWQRPWGLVPPLSFIPVAETSGFITEIGQEVLRLACRQLRPWLQECDQNSVAVNVSVVQLLNEEFAHRVLEILESTGVNPRQIVLEVTESVFLHPGVPGARVADQLSLLRTHGVRVAIDDFGTGHSSLGRLQDLPLDALKIDKIFVDMIQTGEEDLPILRSMVELAQKLGLHVTAEGVETDVQARALLGLGCDALQGYLFSRPQTIHDLPVALGHALRTMQDLGSNKNH